MKKCFNERFPVIRKCAIALLYPPPPIVIDDSSLKNAAESFTIALTLTLGGYESAIAPNKYSYSQ